MSGLEDLLAEFIDRGFDPADADRIREAAAATPLRHELRKITEKQDRLVREVGRLNFREVGIDTPLDALNLPGDLDVTDVEEVRAWATDAAFITPTPDIPEYEQ